MALPSNIIVEVVTPQRFLMAREAKSVVIPGMLGEFEVLPGHLPMLAAMKAGTMLVRDGEQESAYAVSAGFVEVLPDRVIVLAETAEGETEIDIDRARAAVSRAKDSLSSLVHDSSKQAFVMQTALERALARIAAWEHSHDE